MMTPTKMKLRVRKKESGPKSSRRLLAETSPDSKCPICLDRFNNVASLDRCLHRFCFRCIHEWSKNKAECPLCKQPFRSIFHSVKAENDFKEFVLAPVENGQAAPPAGQADGGTASGRVRRPRAARGLERRNRRHQNPTPSASSPDVRLESLTAGMQESEDQEQGVHRMMLRLTERRRSRVEEISLRRLRDQDVVAFRRALYRTGVRVRSGGWDSSRQRDVSAAHLRRNPAYLRRLLPWLQRELTVLYGSHGSLVSIVQHIIMSRITHYDMDDATIRDELRPFLLARTDHFLHEMVSFARSTLSIEAYDQQAVYECPAPSYEEDSSSNSSIITISEDEDSEEVDITEDVPQERVPPVPVVTAAESSLSQSAWDDETPGPSYSTLLQSPSQSQVEVVEPAVDVGQAGEVGSVSGDVGPREDEEEECMIVGYVKPMAERTPELVQLSSDSSEEEQEAVAAETVAATVPKAEASSSQAKAPDSPNSYLRPLSPSSCPYPSASHSPGLHVDRESPHPHAGERDTGRRKHTQHHGVRHRSCSDSDSSVLSGHSEHSRTHRHSGSTSRKQERPRRHDLPRWSHQSSAQSPAVSLVSYSSESSGSPSWEPPQSGDGSPPKRSGKKLKRKRSASAQEQSPQSSVYWHSPGNDIEQKKARKKRREKERDRSQSPVRDSHNRSRDSRSRHTHQEHRLHTGSRSSSSSSSSSTSSSSVGSHQGRPCPEKPAGKRKYKTRHLERAAQRQSSQKSSRDREHRETHNSPAKRRRKAERERSRSPSVEIIFERRAADMASHSHRRKRKRHKKKSRREAKEQSSPVVITIESDSDTNGSQDCVINRTADFKQHVTEASKSRKHSRVVKAAIDPLDDKQHATEAVSSTPEDQHHGTKVSHRTPEDQHHGTKVSQRTPEDQHHGTKVSHRTPEDQHHGTKVSHRTPEDQHHGTKVSHRTPEDQHHGTKVSHRTTKDQHHGTKVSHRTTKDQHHGTKVSHRTTKDQHHGTKVSHRTTKDQHNVNKNTGSTTVDLHHVNSTTDDQQCVTKVTSVNQCCTTDVTDSPADNLHVPEVADDNPGPVVDVTNRGDHQDSAVNTLDRPVEGSIAKASVPGPPMESYSPVTPTEHLLDSPDYALNLEDCVVDVVDRSSFDGSQRSPGIEQSGRDRDLCQDATPPSDTRLLESILQELEDILPEEGQGAESGIEDNGNNQLEDRPGPRRDQSDTTRETGKTESKTRTCDSQKGPKTSPAV